MIRVHLNEPISGLGVQIFIINQVEDQPRRILRYHGDGAYSWEALPEGEAPEPTFTVPGDAGRALLDALARHYDGAEDTRTLRRDYEHERRRHEAKDDLLADVLHAFLPGATR